MSCLLSGIPLKSDPLLLSPPFIMNILFLNIFLISIIKTSQQGDTNSHLFPPGSLGTNQMSEFNVTGPLNSFVEQIQANSRSQEIPVQVPVVQMPTAPQGQGNVIYYGNTPNQPPQPILLGPQNRPALDPALQQLLNSFNTNPMDQQRNTFIQHPNQQMIPAGDLNTPVISYVTCYVGCSHVTNIITNSAKIVTSFNFFTSIVLTTSILFALLF